MTSAIDFRLEQIRGWSEKVFQQQVVDLAQALGWWTHHHYDSRRSTPGWPDLVLLKADIALFIELKTERGKLSAHQVEVIERLQQAGLDARVWRPRHWADRTIHQVLQPGSLN